MRDKSGLQESHRTSLFGGTPILLVPKVLGRESERERRMCWVLKAESKGRAAETRLVAHPRSPCLGGSPAVRCNCQVGTLGGWVSACYLRSQFLPTARLVFR